MEILPDPVQAPLLTIPFVVAFLSLYFILLMPLFDYLTERDQVSAKARKTAAERATQAQATLDRIQQQIASTRKEQGEIRQRARGDAHEEEVKIIGEARRVADAEVGQALERISAEAKDAAATLRGSARVLSQDIATNLLGREPRQSA